MKSRILYTGAFRFPDRDAAAKRVYGIAFILRELGFNVDVAGWEQKNEISNYSYKGFSCISMAELDKRKDRFFFTKLFDFIFLGISTLRWIRKYSNHNIIIAYNPPFLFSILLKIWALKNDVDLILDITEWYEGEHLPGGKFGICSLENYMRMKFSNKIFKNVICISKFLSVQYNLKDVNLICLPPMVVDLVSLCKKDQSSEAISFFYAGQAGKKDNLHLFIKQLPLLENKLGKPIKFSIAGTSYEHLDSISNDIDISDCFKYLNFLGTITSESVINNYLLSDYSVFFREDKRYAIAGFPTKATESLICGCPIITNNIGDIGDLINENDELGILIDINNLENLPSKIVSYNYRRSQCVNTAQKHFYYKNHLDQVKDFMDKV